MYINNKEKNRKREIFFNCYSLYEPYRVAIENDQLIIENLDRISFKIDISKLNKTQIEKAFQYQDYADILSLGTEKYI